MTAEERLQRIKQELDKAEGLNDSEPADAAFIVSKLLKNKDLKEATEKELARRKWWPGEHGPPVSWAA